MTNNQSKNQIYEQESVFGNEKKLGKNSNRFGIMIRLVKAINPAPGTVLDLGCGTGMFADEIKRIYPNADVYGVDVSQKALSIANNKYKTVIFQYADAEEKLPYPDNFFDLVISGEHIEHLVDTDTYLTEINRVMKIGGQIILTTPNLASWFNRILLLFGKQPYKTEASLHLTLPIFTLFGYTFPEGLSTPAVGHLRVMTLDMLKKLLAVYGFETTQSLGRTMLTKPFLRKADFIFSLFPSLASGLIIQATKIEKAVNPEIK